MSLTEDTIASWDTAPCAQSKEEVGEVSAHFIGTAGTDRAGQPSFSFSEGTASAVQSEVACAQSNEEAWEASAQLTVGAGRAGQLVSTFSEVTASARQSVGTVLEG